jgi:hypothetical protein
MDPAERFFWGFCGSAAVELITLLQIYDGPTIKMPERYRRKGFWVVRLLLSIMAGGLAIGYKLDNPIVAINIGAATPSILLRSHVGIETTTWPRGHLPKHRRARRQSKVQQ